MRTARPAIQAVAPRRYTGAVHEPHAAGAGLIEQPPTNGDRLPPTLAALARSIAGHRFRRRLLVAPRTGVGRELLRSLALRNVAWAGVEVTTPTRLAHELVAPALAAEGLSLTDEFDELAVLDAAMDDVLRGATGTLARLAEGPGLRRAVARAVRSLRLAGHTAADVDAVRFRDDEKRAQLALILAAYESRLHERRLTDSAGVLRRALDLLESAGERPPESGELDGGASGGTTLSGALRGAELLLLPDQPAFGLAGRLLELLARAGATVLPGEPVFGLERPPGLLPEAEPLSARAAFQQGATPLAWLHDPAGWSRTALGERAQALAGASGSAAHDSTPAAAADPVPGDVVLDMFAASSVSAELREVLRRCVASGLRWDEVEIVAPDTVAYGVALDGLVRRLGIPVSHASGLPLSRTRPGRALSQYVQWILRDLPVDLLRQMLERGDIAPSRALARGRGDLDRVSGVALARRLRSLKVQGGRRGYEVALARLDAAAAAPAPPSGPSDAAAAGTLDAAGTAQDPADERTAAERSDDAARARAADGALRELLRDLLESVPAPAAAREGWSPAALAEGALGVLSRVPARTAADRSAASRLAERLGRIRATLTRPTTLAAAAAVVGGELDGRLPPPDAEGTGPSPWSTAGGHIYLCDLEHGGWTGRRATFVVGLDAARFPGPSGGDALLVDEDRRRLGAVGAGSGLRPLRTEAERVAARRHAFAALTARLRGRVTFSYARWDAAEGRAVAPASELLQVHRLMTGDATADYEAMHAATSPPASAVPRGGGLIDAADVWLHTLAHDPAASADAGVEARALRRGVATVCALHPGLRAGAAAWRARRRIGGPTAYHGVIEPRPHLDPRVAPTLVVSSTRLETLGACPHRYLLRHVLGIRPVDPELSPEQWLSPAERGRLLHAVFERALREVAPDVDLDSDTFLARTLALLDDEVERRRDLVPPPGAAVLAAEYERMRADVRAFVAMVREDARPRVELELSFGRDGRGPVDITLPDGTSLRMAGAIDRIDELPDGSLAVVDYKTGSSLRFGGRHGPWDGGRRLQHVLYAAAAERMLERTVSRAEYHFPTRRSENFRAYYDAQQLRDGLAVVVELLDLVRSGWFVPTNDVEDCRWCDFAAVCRTSVDAYGKVASQPAEWSRSADAEAVDVLRRLRR
jgi:hypothetical protein